MTTRRAVITGLVLGGTLVFSLGVISPAQAHEAPRVETEVTHMSDGELNVVHVLQLSATQHLLYKADIIQKNDVSGLRARAQVALYSAERFELFADDTPISLEILGAEILGGNLYIYQTGQLDSLPKTWTARNTILRDLSPKFDNVINVPTANGVRSIVFGSRDMDALNSSN